MKTTHLTVLFVVGLAATALAVSPPPDGGYPNNTTAEGDSALFSLTTGVNNTGLGYNALYNNTTGSSNTAIGSQALYANTNGIGNNAIGFSAMIANRSGSYNLADGYFALHSNTTGYDNTAVGVNALGANSVGGGNTAVGAAALVYGQKGSNNTAVGYSTFYNNFFGGSNNIAIGSLAGRQVEHGDNNIEIGNGGTLTDSGVIRIGTEGTQPATYIAGIQASGLAVSTGVGITADGRLGVRASSAHYKEAVKPMDKASEALLALRPVTFRYKKELDPKATPQFGLVAEEVAKVDPDLVVRDKAGKPFTVRYDEVNAMLLNEFLKEHRKVETLEAKVARLEATLEKVSARMESEHAASRLVENR
jgi:hypothetical protein